MKKIRVLLADDHAILRAGVRMLLEAQPDMTVVAEASDGEEAVRQATGTRPDVAVVDLTMPGLSGVETLERLRHEVPATRLLVLTMHDDPGYARLALAAGATGHVIKDAESAELLTAIRTVHRGRTFVQVGAGAEPARAPGARAARARAYQPRGGAAPVPEHQDGGDPPRAAQRQARPPHPSRSRPPRDRPRPARALTPAA
jgi:DNA-binding NarL/FixJ family response regulator